MSGVSEHQPAEGLLDEVAATADSIADDQRRTARQARELAQARRQGASWQQLVEGGAPLSLLALLRGSAERLSQALVPALSGSGNLSREEVNDRIRQEVTLYGMRADVDEELQRLGTHVVEVRRVLNAGGAVGRRLDFLMQELNREANTVGSKASAIEMTNAAVELKLLIEQMREQIQNLE